MKEEAFDQKGLIYGMGHAVYSISDPRERAVSYTHLDVYKRQPVQAAYLPVKGLQQLIKTILTVKKRLNRKLAIEGILLTMVDFRTNYARDIASRVHTCLLYTSRTGFPLPLFV